MVAAGRRMHCLQRPLALLEDNNIVADEVRLDLIQCDRLIRITGKRYVPSNERVSG